MWFKSKLKARRSVPGVPGKGQVNLMGNVEDDLTMQHPSSVPLFETEQGKKKLYFSRENNHKFTKYSKE